ncbi:uncharacterized protein LOC132870982 [Neoarius graeffei]|uniref:uncharacterized protein LOC132870982 n=1 Tax=Neoarius graeffei TaxID=443677 RepID=UPI00298CC1A5|nr:uncharacterized protein LOC132870982 [Neoarius graeffei]
MDRANASVRSSDSHMSSASCKVALAAATARARAQAAHARAAYSRKEIELKMEKARLDATLIALEREREAEAAMAEAAVMEAAAVDFEDECRSRGPELLPRQSAERRTEEYVERHSHLSGSSHSLEDLHSCEEQIPLNPSAYVSVCGDKEGELPTPDHHQQCDHFADGNPHVGDVRANTQVCTEPMSTQLHAGLPAHTPRRAEQSALRSGLPAHTSRHADHSPLRSGLPAYTSRRADHSALRSGLPAHTSRNADHGPLRSGLPAHTSGHAHHSPLRSGLPAHTSRHADYSHFRPGIPVYTHRHNDHSPTTSRAAHCPSDTATSDLARYLARSQLVSSGLTRFDDKPGNYLSWKSSFLNTIDSLDLTAGEEMDLLIRWLGPESAAHARRIRSVNVRDQAAGLWLVWERLEEMYGSPEAIEGALFTKLDQFPKISNKEHHKLRELSDLLLEIHSAKREGYLPGLSYLNTARGINPIVEKLPYTLQDKWVMEGSRYKQEFRVPYPPFEFFLQFVHRQAKARNDPSFSLPLLSTAVRKDKFSESSRRTVSVHKTDVAHSDSASTAEDPEKQCPMHQKPHSLQVCRGFREKLMDERKRILKENNICFKCCASNKHVARDCEAAIKCAECDSHRHPTALHPGPAPWVSKTSPPPSGNGGESDEALETAVVSKCTEVCGEGFNGKSGSKICLVTVYPADCRNQGKRMYAMLDDQSNRSLARSEFFDIFHVGGPTYSYTLKTCSGVGDASGHRATGFVIEPADGDISLTLPTLLECNMIPNNRDEIPTQAAAHSHPHLRAIANEIPEVDMNAEILLLLGRDMLRAHKVRKQINGPHDTPYAQRLDLGWVIVGDVCLGSTHRPPEVTSMKTYILENGRPSHFPPCENHLKVKEKICSPNQPQPVSRVTYSDNLGLSVFQQTKDDHKLASSMEDLLFLETMENEFFQDSANSWVAPLPFRQPRMCLPNNRQYAMGRLKSLHRTLNKNPEMKSHFMDFMQKMLDSHHAELAPPMQDGKEYWYLPFFGVYHPQKPSQIRVVFDSSAQFEGKSLNNVLLSGPNMNNSLLGVLIRFRKNSVAFTADIQQMFHCFLVREDCRDVLRFLWHRDNDLSKEVVDYRMRVHVFGNSPSPAVAIYGLRRAARQGEELYGSDVRYLTDRDFYVDDVLKSVSTVEQAVDLLKRTQKMLAASNLRLHKVASNKADVMDAFPVEDRAKDIQDLDLFVDDLPDQRSLGVKWSLMLDHLTFHVPQDESPYTRRGVLSMVNSLFDPLGFLAPVTIQGRLLLRELSAQASDWDSPLPEEMREKWTEWRSSLSHLSSIHVPRTYFSIPPSEIQSIELCVFSDASVKAISAVAYLRVTSTKGTVELGFVMGKARLAPQPELTIPRLELCAAVMAVEIAEVISEEIDLPLNSVIFYTDSKVVLGYIFNQSRRFYVYVNNRVQRIRQSTMPEQWHYVPTDRNPADHGSRSVPASRLGNTSWLTGPSFLLNSKLPPEQHTEFDLINPDKDVEIRPEVKTLSTHVTESFLDSKRWERFSTWRSLIHAVAKLRHIALCFAHSQNDGDCAGWHICKKAISSGTLEEAENLVIWSVQHEVYGEEFRCITAKCDLSKQSPLIKLNPTIDSSGLLRVGGRISQSGLEVKETNPIILPGSHHITTLIVRHHHERVQHQGRHFTEGAVRESGLWIMGAKRCIGKILNKCVICRRLRGKIEVQQMSELPADRLQPGPPFSHVGMDMFGPWEVSARRTRGGQANSKRWAILFTCLCTRAVHIEVVEEMSASSFINALRRFFALRGPAKQLRSDCGTNFVGACREMGTSIVEQSEVQNYLQEEKCSWIFNPPHSSHMGGVWECMIGVARRILDSVLLRAGQAHLTHESLTTFLAEVTAIINARPLIPVSSDPEHPHILSPSILLTQKSGTSVPPLGSCSPREILKNQWKRVQLLADEFWNRWRKEYLGTLQSRHKWQHKRLDLKPGDVVLLKEKQVRRNEWPMGVVVKTVPSQDGLIRKAEVKIVQQGTTKNYYRPISELVFLLSPE